MDNLADYGYDLFQNNYEWIIEEGFNDSYELADIIFKDAEMDGSLTFNGYKARKELLDTHDLREIFSMLDDLGITMEYASKNMYEEVVHVEFAKQDFIDSLNEELEKIDDPCEILTERETIFAAIANHIKEDFTIYPRLKAARKKLEISSRRMSA